MNAQLEEASAPAEITKPLITRFWRKVEMAGDAECWLWKGSLDRLGYGQFALGGGVYRAHRIAYWMWNCKWFAPSVKLRHSCDTRRCCNPMHLLPGTQADNMRDRKIREGYRSMARGERHGLAKLRCEQIQAIRATSDSLRALASRYGVSEGHISRIRKGHAWRWLD